MTEHKETTPLLPKPKYENNEFAKIMDKLKNRIPVFIIASYCTTTTLIFGDSSNSAEISTNILSSKDTFCFKLFYLFLCIMVLIWDIWHASRAFTNQHTNCKFFTLNRLLFCLFSAIVSVPLFVITSNLGSFGLPFNLIFGLDRNTTFIVYGFTFPFLYFMTIVENNYWKNTVTDYIALETADDIGEMNTNA
jgi:hypothetical protein